MSKYYCNPVSFSDKKVHTNPDPFVMRFCGRYYCYSTGESGITICVSDDLINWTDKGYAIKEEGYHCYWAPSVIYINGNFFMYYSNISIEKTDCHMEYLKLAISNNPLGPFQWKKTFFDQFSIDSHPIIWNNELYMFYSVNDWIGTEKTNAGTCIVLDKMKTPEEFCGEPQPVILPSLLQEIYKKNRFQDGRDWYTIEGACPITKGNRTWLLYSANAYENTNYFIGTAIAENKEFLSDMKWEKVPNKYTWNPLIKKNEYVEGTGHNTISKAPNMVDDWIIYHGRNAKEDIIKETEQRVMRIDPLFFSGKKLFCTGPSWERKGGPRTAQFQIKNKQISFSRLFCKRPHFYKIECWMSAEKQHTGARYGVYADYRDEKNYLEIQINSGKRELQIWYCKNGTKVLMHTQILKKGFDYTVPHLLGIQKNGEYYKVFLDDAPAMEIRSEFRNKSGSVGVISYFTKLFVHSFTLTEHADLQGNELQEIGLLYQWISEETVSVLEGGLYFAASIEALPCFSNNSGFAEEWNLKSVSEAHAIAFKKGEKCVYMERGEKKEFTVYHIWEDGKEQFFCENNRIEITEGYEISTSVVLNGVVINNYRYTKI